MFRPLWKKEMEEEYDVPHITCTITASWIRMKSSVGVLDICARREMRLGIRIVLEASSAYGHSSSEKDEILITPQSKSS